MRHILLFASLCCLLLSSCSLMEQRLQSKSGLYGVPLEHSYKVPVNGFWTWGKGNPYARQSSVTIYIAPLNVSLVEKKNPELAPHLVKQMHELMTTKMNKTLAEANAANRTQWKLTSDAGKADIRIDLAVVSLRTQKPGLHIAGKVLGYVAPTGVGDAVDFISKGDITLEGAIRDCRSGQIYMAFKDSNRAKLRFYHKDTYRRTGNVDANLRLWAQKLALIFRESALDRLGNQTLKEKLENRSAKEVIKAHLN